VRRINDTPRLSNLHRECRGAPGQLPGVHREVRNMLRATSPPDVAYKQASRCGPLFRLGGSFASWERDL
jgi:hypothetical protein